MSSDRRAAFTLVEVMVVIGILAMVLAMAMPSFIQVLRKEPLRKATSDIEAGCVEARAQAILKGETAELVIEAVSGRVFVPPANPRHTAAGPDSVEVVPQEFSGKPAFQEHLDPNVAVTLLYVNLKDRMEAEQAKVRFYPNGTSDDFTIVLESATGTRKVSLDCITGLADVEVIR